MMDWTDRHCRVFHRLMSRRARLYTEMLTTGAIIHGDRRRLLGFDASEHPVALQLGGSDPADLATAAKIGEDFGYDEINLNVGCPSDRVKDGRFGACLMAEPALVADDVAAMKRAVKIPVTVKCRISSTGVGALTPWPPVPGAATCRSDNQRPPKRSARQRKVCGFSRRTTSPRDSRTLAFRHEAVRPLGVTRARIRAY